MHRARAFTLLEVAIIVAIIGMILMMIVGYLLAPKQKGPLPAVPAPTPLPSSAVPGGKLPNLLTSPPATPSPATPAPAATPMQTIQISPQSAPLFR